MRKLITLSLIALPLVVHAQVWEKFVAPGLTYRMEVDVLIPRVIHALRWTPGSKYTQAKPQLANRAIYGHDTNGRGTVSHMVEREGAIGGINADFFPWTGDPLGFMTSGGELLSKPFPNRSFFAWGSESAQFGRAAQTITLSSGGREVTIDGVNEEAGEGMICLNTSVAGYAKCKIPGYAVSLRLESGPLLTKGVYEGIVKERFSDSASIRVEESEVVLIAYGSRSSDLEGLRPGDKASITVDTVGMDFNAMPDAVGGGPLLLKDGVWANQWDMEGFNADFALKRHPRTAIGKSADGDIWFVAIDGRQSQSAGATLLETAKTLLRLGCTDALNLDGGGSTTLNLFGASMNRPSDGKERAVANGIVFMGPKPSPMDSKLQLYGPAKIARNTTRGFRVRLNPNFAVPNSEVFWSATGAAWIDQGGYLRPISSGKCTIRAFAWGRTLTKSVEISSGK